ncbi:MAG: nucleotidyltransferase family protein [Tissierellaceae bacterium]
MITGIILAAGFSKRMGRNKLLVTIGGMPLVERVINAAKGSELDELILVYREKPVMEIGKRYGIKTVYNGSAHLGQSESLKLGVRNASGADAYMFFVGDQPFLTKELINHLIREYGISNSSILVPYYRGSKGMPMIMSSIYKDELLKVLGDKGGRDLVKKHHTEVKKIAIEDHILGLDIDWEKDLDKILT